MIDLSYFITPFFAWLIAGILKLIINSIKAKKLALDLVGYGGLPSNHSAIVSSTAALIAFNEGIHSAAFGVAITLAFIVILDANALRRQIGKHAEEINTINRALDSSTVKKLLRERMGHTKIEIAAGILVGICVAAMVHWF